MSISEDRAVLQDGTTIETREERLAAGADELAGARGSIAATPNALLIASGALLTAGLTAILLAWAGASRSTIIEEQVPYLISGGLLGVALSVVGALAFFTHWLTVQVREARAHDAARAAEHAELLAEVRALRQDLARSEESNGTARSAQRGRQVRRASSGS